MYAALAVLIVRGFHRLEASLGVFLVVTSRHGLVLIDMRSGF
jgi:hypothetical protein